MKNKLILEEINRIQEVMFGKTKPLLLEQFQGLMALRKYISELGAGFVIGTSKTMQNKVATGKLEAFFTKLENDLRKSKIALQRGSDGKIFAESWDDALDYIFADAATTTKYMSELFSIRAVQADFSQYLRNSFKGGITRLGSEADNLKNFSKDLFAGEFNSIFPKKFLGELKVQLELLGAASVRKTINKFKLGDFTGARQFLSLFSSSHAKFLKENMPNLSVLGKVGSTGWPGFYTRVKNLFTLTWTTALSPIVLTGDMLVYMKKFVVNGKGALTITGKLFGVFMVALTLEWLRQMMAEVVNNPVAKIIQNGHSIYESVGPTARDLFKLEDGLASSISASINEQVSNTGTKEDVILEQLLSAKSMFGICHVAYVYEETYNVSLAQDLTNKTSWLGVEKYKFWDGVFGDEEDVDDYDSILRGLRGLDPVKINEKNKGIIGGVTDVFDIPNMESLMVEGPIIIANGNSAAYYTGGKYPPMDIVNRLSLYLNEKDSSYDDSNFDSKMRVLSKVDFETAVSGSEEEMTILDGKVSRGVFTPSVEVQEELLKDNKSEVSQSFKDGIEDARSWWSDITSSW
tara:strand:- start:1252 stop:2979 length:1728 start_codon:yes stop_codon:yes gene_type:complete